MKLAFPWPFRRLISYFSCCPNYVGNTGMINYSLPWPFQPSQWPLILVYCHLRINGTSWSSSTHAIDICFVFFFFFCNSECLVWSRMSSQFQKPYQPWRLSINLLYPIGTHQSRRSIQTTLILKFSAGNPKLAQVRKHITNWGQEACHKSFSYLMFAREQNNTNRGKIGQKWQTIYEYPP